MINLDEIEYIQGLKDYLKIHVVGTNKAILTLINFKEILDKLPPNQFLRVHKSFVVNVGCIKTVQRNRIVINDVRIPIGGSYKANFFQSWDFRAPFSIFHSLPSNILLCRKRRL